MKRERKPERYSDLAFEPSLDQNGDLKTVKNRESISQALFTLFHTVPGSRVMMPGYGASLRPFLFENFDEDTGRKMGQFIRRAIEKYEPRILVDNIKININEDVGRFEIDILYKVIDTQEVENVTFNLERL